MNVFNRIFSDMFDPEVGDWLRGFALIKNVKFGDGKKTWSSYSYDLRAYDSRSKNFKAAAMEELLKWASENCSRDGVEFGVVVRGEHQCDLISRDGDDEHVIMSAVDRDAWKGK